MIDKIGTKENIFGDGIGFVEHYDFSRANMSLESRIMGITQVASICYQSPKALGSEVLYNRLMAESLGLPSSSFEFVPVLARQYGENMRKFGEFVEDGWLLTNYRAMFADGMDLFNTEAECAIIKKHFNVFLFKVDMPTRSQMVRHRVNWQELSRRYVSGKRVPFEFYMSEDMRDMKPLYDHCVDEYYKLLDRGVKPQEARRVIPQAAYTQIWGGFQPSQLDNFMKLRLDEHSQYEIRQVALAMKELLAL